MNLVELANKVFDYLKLQTFDKVMAILVIGLSASYVVYIEPQRDAENHRRYAELYKQIEERAILREEVKLQRWQQLEKELARLNTTIESRDKENASFLKDLLERIK